MSIGEGRYLTVTRELRGTGSADVYATCKVGLQLVMYLPDYFTPAVTCCSALRAPVRVTLVANLCQNLTRISGCP